MPMPPKNDLDRKYGILAFKIIGEFGAAIAAPVVILTLLGKHLDETYGSKPAFLIGGFVLAAIVSTAYVVKRTRVFNAEYQRLEEEAKKRKERNAKSA